MTFDHLTHRCDGHPDMLVYVLSCLLLWWEGSNGHTFINKSLLFCLMYICTEAYSKQSQVTFKSSNLEAQNKEPHYSQLIWWTRFLFSLQSKKSLIGQISLKYKEIKGNRRTETYYLSKTSITLVKKP